MAFWWASLDANFNQSCQTSCFGGGGGGKHIDLFTWRLCGGILSALAFIIFRVIIISIIIIIIIIILLRWKLVLYLSKKTEIVYFALLRTIFIIPKICISQSDSKLLLKLQITESFIRILSWVYLTHLLGLSHLLGGVDRNRQIKPSYLTGTN